MKSPSRFLSRGLVLLVMVFAVVAMTSSAHAQTVEITYVEAQQYGSFVRIFYDLSVAPSGPVTISLWGSDDGALSYDLTAGTVYGDIGDDVLPGQDNMIVWHVYSDHPEHQIAEAAVLLDSVPAAGGSSVPESALFEIDTTLEWLDIDGDGTPDDIFDLDQDGTPDAVQDFDGNGLPDAFEDIDVNGIPDAYQDLNGNGISDGFEDADGDGVPDWFQDRLPLYSPSHPDGAKWYFIPDVTVDYTNYMAGTSLYGYLWVMDQSAGTVVDYGGTFRAAAELKVVQSTPTESGTWHFHIATIGTDRQIIDGSQRNLEVNVYVDGFTVSSESHPDQETPSLNKTFTALVEPASDPYPYAWAQEPDAGWSGRSGHQAVVFQNKLWVMGGNSIDGGYRNDVWSSVDGTTWVLETAGAGWSGRFSHQAVAFDNKLWVMGGSDGSLRNDVWSSVDGTTWVQETANAGWSGRGRHQAVVFQNKLWVMGGSGTGYRNDVWSSVDGVTWVQETANAGWSPRRYHQTVVFQNRLLVMGGYDGSRHNDVWSSVDGKTWVLETAGAGWSPRFSYQAVVFQNRLWVMGGYDGSYRNDVWRMTSVLDVSGYYYLHDAYEDTVPTESDSFSETADITIPGDECPPGTYWFHVIAVDALGALSAPAHYKFTVTDAPPVVSSPTHPDENVPGSGVEVTFDWTDGGVPDVVKYWYAWGTSEGATPSTAITETSLTFDCVDAGVHWFVVQSEDQWGYLSPVAQRKVTVGAVSGPTISSSTHPDPHMAYAARDVALAWTPATGSGALYYYVWDRSPYSVPTAGSTSTSDATLEITNLSLGRYFLHLAATDDCGNLTAPTHFAVRVREARPPDVQVIPTSNRSNVGFAWTDPDSFATGTPKFYLDFDQTASTNVTAASADSTDNYTWNEFGKPDGVYYFHIRSQDTHGNLSAQGDYTLVLGDAMVGLSAPSETITKSGPVYYTVTYPGATSVNLTAGNVTLNRTGTADGTVTVEATAEPLAKKIVISNITGDGTLGITIAAGTATYAGGITAPAIGPSGTFTVDNTPPVLTITGPAPTATASGPVDYVLTYEGATDVLLDANDITLVSDPANATGATVELSGDGNTTRTVTLTNCWGEGRLHIEVAAGTASDAAGDLANAATSASVTVDSVAPTGGITINGGAAWTNSTNVTLALAYSDGNGSGVAQMRFSNDGAWSSWETVATSKTWTLYALDEGKTVHCQFRDNAGNVSASATDTISLDTTAPTGTVTIDSGADWTSTSTVALTLTFGDGSGSGVADMRFSNDGTDWSSWEAGGTSKTWTLSAGDGLKSVYTQFRDMAGNISQAVSDGINLDTTGPTGTIAVNSGAPYTNTLDVTLGLTASDGANGIGVADMRFSQDNTNWTDWETFDVSRGWTLTSGDGTKTAYVQFRDTLENTSTSFSDTIVLDMTPPDVTLTSTVGVFTNTTFTVTATFTETVTGFEADDVTVTNGTVFAFSGSDNSYQWTITPALDGAVTVAVAAGKCTDVAGNTNTASNTLSTTYDITPPTGSVLINEGAVFTASGTVSLTLSANDGAGSGVSDMRFSNDGTDWSLWEVVGTSKTWTLSAGDGLKSVYAQFRDAVGNISQSVSDGINLDTTGPTGTIIINSGAPYTNTLDVTLGLTASDGANGIGVAHMRFSSDGTTWDEWEDFSASKPWTLAAGDGEKTVYVQFRDALGNTSISFSDTIVLDTVPPTVSIGEPSAGLTASRDITYTVTYGEADNVVLAWNDVVLNRTDTANGVVTVSGAGNTTRTVTISNISGGGTLSISLVADTASDNAGNLAPAADPSDPVIVVNCDINNDGRINAVDVQFVINAALGLDIGDYDADVNRDARVNALDVQLVINAVLGII